MWIYDYKSEQDNPYRQQPFVRITTISFADNLPAWTYPWHKHRDEYELAFIAAGSGRLDIGAHSFSLQEGSAVVIQPGVSHRFASDDPQGMRYYTLRFDAKYSMGDILDYLSENIDQKITLKVLAQRFNISESHLNRLFRQAYHISPIDYLIQSRIAMSTEYLTKSGFTINEIAERVGYANPAHFTNMFIKRIGCTPSEYREQMLQDKPEPR